MAQFPQPLMDLPLVPPAGNMFYDDYELYPPGSDVPYRDHSVNERAAQLQLQLARIEESAKGNCAHELPQYTPWSDRPVSTYHVGFPNAGLSVCFPPGSDQTSPPWSADFSSISDADSPRSDWRSMDYNCYPSPPYSYDEPVMSRIDLGGCATTNDMTESRQSVALCQVQQYPDLDLKLDPESTQQVPMCSGAILQSQAPQYDGFDTSMSVQNTPSEIAADSDISFSPQPQRLPKATPTRRGKSSRAASRISKRQATSRSNPSRAFADKNPSARTFVCSFSHYGCPSTFVSKNEWKRHVASQHLQLGFYRCDVGGCNVNLPIEGKPSRQGLESPSSRIANDFNRKDLFTQHQRRMHTPWQRRAKHHPSEEEKHAFEQSLEHVRARCWHQQRNPPMLSRCGFCGRMFSGVQSWDERMEHVGRHFEKDEPLSQEAEDIELTKWAVEEGLVQLVEGRWMLSSLAE